MSADVISYKEGPNSMGFGITSLSDGRRAIVVPGPERWAENSPPWAEGRRDEVLERIRRATARLGWAWQVS